MRKKETIAYFVLAAFLFALLNVPTDVVKKVRLTKLFSTSLFAGLHFGDQGLDTMQLQIENNGLKEQIGQIREWLKNQDRIEMHLNKMEELSLASYSDYYKRRMEDLEGLLEREVFGIEAMVIFRDPAIWSSGVWVDKGERDNRKWGRKMIAKNSPVVLGQALVGLVEEVEEDRSYVRLITDAALTPAVRAVRGNEQNAFLLEHVNMIEEQLKLRDDLALDETLFQQLETLRERLYANVNTSYLAKGEIRGTATPLWRSRSQTLKGIGFNYEFADREGPALELHKKSTEALLKVGDLLVTSGLDGIFPRGLRVATVSKIFSLKEGAHSYEIEAKSVVPNLNEITYVQILSVS